MRTGLERFRAKWVPVRVKKTRQNKNLEPRSDSIGTETALVLAILIGTGLPACAGEGFDIVIPGRPGVPIIINGVDASYSVIEGQWGLGKSYHEQPVVYGGRFVTGGPNVGHWYPSLGHKPGYGRFEIQPPANRILPKPAESYHKSWSSESAPPPIVVPAQPEVPFSPPVIVAPQIGGAGVSPGPDPRLRRPQPLPR